MRLEGTDNSKNGGNGLTRKSLSFYKKRTCWYAEVPEHTEAQNQMVSGADVMCETMACGHKRVTIDFLYGEECKPSSLKCLACLDKIGQTAYGATYRLSSESGGVPLPDMAWLCNVTKTVCGGNHPTHIYITDVRPNDEPPYGRTARRSECKRVHLPWERRTDLIMSNDEYWRELHKACPPSKEEREEKPLDDMTDEELEEAANRYFGRLNSKEADKVFERRQLGFLKAEYEWEQNGCKGERPESIGSIIAASYNPFLSGTK